MQKIFLENEKVQLKLKDDNFDFSEYVENGGDLLKAGLKLIAQTGLKVDLKKIIDNYDCEVSEIVDIDFGVFKDKFKETDLSVESCILINNLVCEFQNELYNEPRRKELTLHEDILTNNQVYGIDETVVIKELESKGIIVNTIEEEEEIMLGKFYPVTYYTFDVVALKREFETISK